MANKVQTAKKTQGHDDYLTKIFDLPFRTFYKLENYLISIMHVHNTFIQSGRYVMNFTRLLMYITLNRLGILCTDSNRFFVLSYQHNILSFIFGRLGERAKCSANNILEVCFLLQHQRWKRQHGWR